jgi:hypothetical protein
MNIRYLLATVLFGAAMLPSPLLAAGPVSTSFTTDVAVRSTRSVDEIDEYVTSIERRLQRGRYDVAGKGEQQWIVNSIQSVPTCRRWRAPSKPA